MEVDEVEMLDPPWPDLKAVVFGRSHYFELGEVVPEDFLRADSKRGKTLRLDPSPLIAVWNPVGSHHQEENEETVRGWRRTTIACALLGEE